MAYRNARFKRTPTEAVERGEGGRPQLVYGPAKRLLQPTPAVLGAPGVHPDPTDPHAAVGGGLVEAFEEVLDLGQRLLLSHGLAGGRALPSLRLRAIFGMMQRLDLTDNERAVLITALRRLVDFEPRSLSPQTHALKAILERLEPHKPQPIPDTAGTG